MKRQPLVLVISTVIVSALAIAGCDDTSTTPTPPEVLQTYQVSSAPIDPLGQAVFAVETAQAGPVQVMLAGVVVDNPLRSISPVLELGLGDVQDSECKPVTTNSTAPKFSAALHYQMAAGVHCVIVRDTVGLPEPVGVVVRIVSPPVLATNDKPGTDTFASTITTGGLATRTVPASTPGTIRLTLGSLLPSNPAAGLALGLPASDGTGCLLARIVTATPGSTPQLTADVDAGVYCMGIFDVGHFAATNTFSATIQHP